MFGEQQHGTGKAAASEKQPMPFNPKLQPKGEKEQQGTQGGVIQIKSFR